MALLDCQKRTFGVFVFRHDGTYRTNYVESYHIRDDIPDPTERSQKEAREIDRKLTGSSYARHGNILVVTDDVAGGPRMLVVD